MQILIVGAGLVGSTLAEKLSRDGHDVALIDSDAAKFRELSNTMDVHVLEGNGATATMLRRAGIEEADLVVAATNSDEVNIVVGLLASSIFHVGRLVVRLRDPQHDETFELINQANPVDHVRVNPDGAAVERIATLLTVPGAVDVVSFLENRLLVAGFRIGALSDFVGLRVSDMNLMFANTPTLAVAIQRNDDWIIPHGGEVIAQDDLVYFAISREHMEGVLQLVGVPRDHRRDVMIAGASTIGLELARRLEKLDMKVVLIEEDETRARACAEELRHTTVLHGSSTSKGLLEEEDIARVSTFVAVTEDHQSNLVSGLLAKRLGAGRAVVLVDNPELVDLVGQLGIDAIISPRVLVIGLTLQHILGGRVHSAAQLLEDRIEIVEAEVAKGSALTRGVLAEVKLPRGVLVAALGRGDTLLVPRGSDRAEAGDRVLLITTTENEPKLARFLSE
jgi:trk/ktr system potassium uptake protein